MRAMLLGSWNSSLGDSEHRTSGADKDYNKAKQGRMGSGQNSYFRLMVEEGLFEDATHGQSLGQIEEASPVICVGGAFQVWEPKGSEASKQGCGCSVQGTAMRSAWLAGSEGQRQGLLRSASHQSDHGRLWGFEQGIMLI